jgi:hypothetical protein
MLLLVVGCLVLGSVDTVATWHRVVGWMVAHDLVVAGSRSPLLELPAGSGAGLDAPRVAILGAALVFAVVCVVAAAHPVPPCRGGVVRPLSRETLARDAASKMAAAGLAEGACSGQGTRWSELERRHRRSSRPGQARAVIEEIRREFCGGCPALVGCGYWAEVQLYTGLAAGAAYEAGRRQQPAWTAPRAGRQRRAG